MLEVLKEQFPVRLDLPDGAVCTIRPIEEADESAFRAFHSVIPEEEQLFIRSQIKDGSLFRTWIEDRQGIEHFALLAYVDGRLAAMG
ncbi:MAG: hypothetical protein AAGF67_17000, partial [Verrucomicrobiota bacterium]